MNRLISILAGLMLIGLGALMLLSNVAVTLFGLDLTRYVTTFMWAPLLIGVGLLILLLALQLQPPLYSYPHPDPLQTINKSLTGV